MSVEQDIQSRCTGYDEKYLQIYFCSILLNYFEMMKERTGLCGSLSYFCQFFLISEFAVCPRLQKFMDFLTFSASQSFRMIPHPTRTHTHTKFLEIQRQVSHIFSLLLARAAPRESLRRLCCSKLFFGLPEWCGLSTKSMPHVRTRMLSNSSGASVRSRNPLLHGAVDQQTQNQVRSRRF